MKSGKESNDLLRKRTQEDRKAVEEREIRDQVRYAAKRERERNQRLDLAGKKKSKLVRDRDRDISEKIALGIA